VQELTGDRLSAQERQAFADDWRREFFVHRENVAHGDLPWMNSDNMQILGLEVLKKHYPFLQEIDDLESFAKSVWHNLKAFNGAADSIARLRTKYTCAVLTILSWESIVIFYHVNAFVIINPFSKLIGEVVN